MPGTLSIDRHQRRSRGSSECERNPVTEHISMTIGDMIRDRATQLLHRLAVAVDDRERRHVRGQLQALAAFVLTDRRPAAPPCGSYSPRRPATQYNPILRE